jgi:hypothetical protein
VPQYRRIGHDFTTRFDQPPSPEHWELVEDEPAKPAAKAARTEPEPEES